MFKGKLKYGAAESEMLAWALSHIRPMFWQTQPRQFKTNVLNNNGIAKYLALLLFIQGVSRSTSAIFSYLSNFASIPSDKSD